MLEGRRKKDNEEGNGSIYGIALKDLPSRVTRAAEREKIRMFRSFLIRIENMISVMDVISYSASWDWTMRVFSCASRRPEYF